MLNILFIVDSEKKNRLCRNYVIIKIQLHTQYYAHSNGYPTCLDIPTFA